MRPTRPYTLACRCSYLWFAALVLLTVPGVAQQDSTNVRIHMLIEDDLERHMPTIRQLTSGMTPEERMALYEKHKERAAGPFVLNMMLGMGIGSWAQGDEIGGAVGLFGGLVFAATVLSFTPDVMIMGGIIYLVAWTYDLARPWAYAAERNGDLRKALRFDDAAVLHVRPAMFQLLGGSMAPGLSIAMSF